MVQVTVDEATRQLADLLERVGKGEEFVITKDDAPLAMLSPIPPMDHTMQEAGRLNRHESAKLPRQPGSAKGIVLYIAEDFDSPLEDFKEYM